MFPRIELTPAAAEALLAATHEAGEDARFIKIFVDERWEHGLDVAPRRDEDLAIDAHGVTLLCHPELAERLHGVVIDYVDGPEGSGFRIDNPNAPAAVQPMTVRELKARLDAGEVLTLLDVRTPHEVATARIEGSRRIDLDDLDELSQLALDTPLVFYCHHGIRSHAAARYFVRRGFRTVYNLLGGIDAWSVDIDPSVPRY